MDDKQKNWKEDFKKYLFFLTVQIVLVIALIVSEGIIDDCEILTLNNLKLLGVSVLINILMVLLLLLMLAGNTFRYEFFTYGFIFFSVIMVGSAFFMDDYESVYIAGIMGMPMLCTGLFSRLVLWKYDKAVSGN